MFIWFFSKPWKGGGSDSYLSSVRLLPYTIRYFVLWTVIKDLVRETNPSIRKPDVFSYMDLFCFSSTVTKFLYKQNLHLDRLSTLSFNLYYPLRIYIRTGNLQRVPHIISVYLNLTSLKWLYIRFVVSFYGGLWTLSLVVLLLTYNKIGIRFINIEF